MSKCLNQTLSNDSNFGIKWPIISWYVLLEYGWYCMYSNLKNLLDIDRNRKKYGQLYREKKANMAERKDNYDWKSKKMKKENVGKKNRKEKGKKEKEVGGKEKYNKYMSKVFRPTPKKGQKIKKREEYRKKTERKKVSCY